MFKPKSTTKNVRALWYKRFTQIEQSASLRTLYKTPDGKYWWFNAETFGFAEVSADFSKYQVVEIDETTNLTYLKWFFRYSNGEWLSSQDPDELCITLLSASYGNIARYQTHKYYYAGSFDFVIKGSIEKSTVQYIKGLTLPIKAMNISHYDDNIQLEPDDLCVVFDRLYSVENPEVTQKRMPKPYNIYFATLNSIL